MDHHDDNWAVFWCSLLGPILLDEVEPGERRAFLKNLSQQEVLLPNGRRKRISLSTLRRKVRRFRQHKLGGLRRKTRQDRGQARKKRDAMIDRAQKAAATPLAPGHQRIPEQGIWSHDSQVDHEPPSPPGWGNAPQARRDQRKDPLPLDARSQQRAVGWRLLRRAAGPSAEKVVGTCPANGFLFRNTEHCSDATRDALPSRRDGRCPLG